VISGIYADGSISKEILIGSHSPPSGGRLRSLEYRPGRLADALSRREQQGHQLLTLSTPTFQLFAELRKEINDNSELQHLHDNVTAIRGSPWHSEHGLILKGNRVYVPPNSASLPAVLLMSHT